MSFVEIFAHSDEPDEQPAQEQFVRQPWFGPPEDELGVCVHLGLVLGRSPNGVVALPCVVVYSSGLYIELRALARGLRQTQLQRLFHEQHTHIVDPAEGLPEGFLRIGVELPGGERVSNLDRRMPWHDQEPQGSVFHQAGGGGGQSDNRTVALRPGYWLWPLPAPGTIRLSCEWPLVGIPFSTVELDADSLRDAAARSQPLWEDE